MCVQVMPNGAKNWCFTINNYTDVPNWELLQDHVEYLVYQGEVGENGTPHLQGYISLKQRHKWQWIQTIDSCFKTAHFEVAKGTAAQNREYCTKDEGRIEGPYEHGKVPKGQGARSDLAAACELVKTRDVKAVAEEYPTVFVKYYKGLDELRKKVQPKTTVVPFEMSKFKREPLELKKATLVWGESGTGKTSWALAHFKCPLLVSHVDDLKELDTRVHDGLVFDDMSFTHLPIEARIHLLDTAFERQIHCRYQNAVIPAGVKRIFCHNNDDIFLKTTEPVTLAQIAAIDRRLEKVHIVEQLFE